MSRQAHNKIENIGAIGERVNHIFPCFHWQKLQPMMLDSFTGKLRSKSDATLQPAAVRRGSRVAELLNAVSQDQSKQRYVSGPMPPTVPVPNSKMTNPKDGLTLAGSAPVLILQRQF